MSKNGQNNFTQNSNSQVRIKIINEKCIGAATCIIKAPKTFDLDDDGIAYVLDDTWDTAVDIIAAAKSCPTTAVIVEDLNGNRIWPKNV